MKEAHVHSSFLWVLRNPWMGLELSVQTRAHMVTPELLLLLGLSQNS